MKKIIETIPNYSEGKSLETMNKIILPFKKRGIFLCRLEMDEEYNRSVVTIIGEKDAVFKGLVESAKLASELIDLRVQRGEHPRMGAIDVIPILPIKDISEEECQKMVLELGKQINQTTNIPVYLYNKSAKHENRKRLPDIRRGEFEGLMYKMKNKEWYPDIGSAIPHPSAGAVAIGVREPLIAYNIDLNTNNKEIANKIAKKIRFSSGGIPFVQAKAAQLISRGNVQVTINLINYHETSLWKVFSAVKQEAELLGVKAISSEIIGLIPQEALLLSLREILGEDIDIDLERLIFLTKKYFLLRDFDEEKILDYYLNKIMDGKYE